MTKGDIMKKFLKKLTYTLIVTATFMYGVYTIAEQEIELNNITKEKEKYIALYEEEEIKYEQLMEIKENVNSDAYIEKVAREKLGLVMPYEIIFVDASIW